MATQRRKRRNARSSGKEVPFHRPWLSAAEEREVLAALRSGWLTTGARVRQFEKLVAEYLGCKHAVAVSSGTAALHVALAALDIAPGHEVITTPITFAATANVIALQGARPVLVDVDPTTLNIDPKQIESRITNRTKAILPVHLYGHPCDMDAILGLARRYGLAVVEDAAHAIGAEYKGRKVGSLGDLTCFSFYATKNITTGEGGMITTESAALAAKARLLSGHGITADPWRRHGDGRFEHWDIIRPGYKYNLSDIHAALGMHQLGRGERFWQKRKHLVDFYRRAFRGMPEIGLVGEMGDIRHAYHLCPILVRTEALGASRDEVMQGLRDAGVGVGVHFRALHLLSYYRQTYGFKPGDFPNAEFASDRLISLPLYPRMTKADANFVIGKVKETLARLKKQNRSSPDQSSSLWLMKAGGGRGRGPRT